MDMISRQAAIDALWKSLYEYEDKTEKQFKESEELDIYDWIEHRIFVQNMSDIDRQTLLDLPPAHPEQRWIPCSERLPEFGRNVLISTREYTAEGVLTRGGIWYQFRWGDVVRDNAVIAWQPLPEPFKEGEE